MRGGVSDVLSGTARWAAVAARWEDFIPTLPDDSIDLLVTSPPYEGARTYGIDFNLTGEAWVAWMVELVRALRPKVKGLIAINCEGQTRDYRYSCVPQLLAADLHRAGFNLRRPVIFHRVGIPGSGSTDWLRGDTESVVCVTRPGKLPWSDNTACGHPPKWAPGGDPSYRAPDGTRVNDRNQWGMHGGSGMRRNSGKRRTHGTPAVPTATNGHPQLFDGEPAAAANGKSKWGKTGHGGTMAKDGQRDSRPRPSHRGTATSGRKNGDNVTEPGHYDPPVLANPGNLLQVTYTADEVAELLKQASDVFHANVGGGCMGHAAAHDNEAPFPVELPAFFVKSFCPPGGVVLDPFLGSGTTIHAALENGRRAIGCDVRDSMIQLTKRRMRTVTPCLPLSKG